MNLRSSMVLALLLALPAGLLAQKTGETVKDRGNGMAFKVPKDWVSIPVDPLDKLTLHKYQADRPDQGKKNRAVNYTAHLDLLFIPASIEPEVKENKAYSRPLYTSYTDYLKEEMKIEAEAKPSKKKVRKLPVTIYDLPFSVTAARGGKVELHLRTTLFHTEEGDFAMQFICLEEHYKKRHSQGIESSIRSFTLLEKEEESGRDTLEKLDANQRYHQEQIEKLSSGWYYFWSKNKNYLIFSNTEKSFSQKIAVQLETMRSHLKKDFPGEPKVKWIPIVRVCKNKNEYIGYGGKEGSLGYWWDLTKEFVFFRNVAAGENLTMKTLRHEAFHQYIHFQVGCALGSWFDEGQACFYEGCEPAGRKLRIRPSVSRREGMQRALVNGKFTPLKNFVELNHKGFMDDALLHYAQAWAVIFFLREGKREGSRMQKQWERIPEAYLGHLKQALVELEKKYPDKKAKETEVNFELADKAKKTALARTFEGWTDEDWARLEAAWIDFNK